MNNLDELIKKLAQARSYAVLYAQQLKAFEDAFYQKPDVISAKDQKRAWEGLVDQLEGQVRVAAIEAFQESGEKKPHAAVQIKAKTSITINHGKAIAYSIEHKFVNWLNLNEPTFKGFIKNMWDQSGTLPEDLKECASVLEEPTATIARDLSDYIEVEDVDKSNV